MRGERAPFVLLAAVLGAAGCQFLVNGLSIGGDGSDAAVPPADLAIASAPDLATPSPDLGPAPRFSRLDLYAGSGYGFADGLGPAAQLANPNGIVADGAGNLYVADTNNALIRMIDANANVTTVAGRLGQQTENDGAADQAAFDHPEAIAWDGTSLWVTDFGASTVRQIVMPGAAVSTLVDQGTLNSPKGIVADGAGNLYVSDSSNAVIRKIVVSGVQISIVAGAVGQTGLTDGVGGAARFNEPRGLVLDGAGTLYVADGANNAIRAITLASGKVVTLASGAPLRFPRGLVLDGNTLYIGNTENNCVLELALDTLKLTVLAGVPGTAAQQPGPLPAETFSPWGLARLPSGALVYTDNASNDVMIIH